MEYMTHEVSVIEFMENFVIQFWWKLFEPIFFVALKGNIQGNNIFYLLFMYRAVTNSGRSHGKAQEHSCLS